MPTNANVNKGNEEKVHKVEVEERKPQIQNQAKRQDPDDVKFKSYRTDSDLSITCYNEYGNLTTYNFKAGEKVKIADVPSNTDILAPFIERNHLKKI